MEIDPLALWAESLTRCNVLSRGEAETSLRVYKLRSGGRPVVLELLESYLFKMGPSNT